MMIHKIITIFIIIIIIIITTSTTNASPLGLLLHILGSSSDTFSAICCLIHATQ